MTRKLTATPYLFLLPALVVLGVFVIYPIIAVIYYSFTDYNIVTPPTWIGLENFQNLIGDSTFWLALTHSIVLPLVTPIIIDVDRLAIAVNRRYAGVHLSRALFRARRPRQASPSALTWRWLFERSDSSTACCCRGTSSASRSNG
jgi:ABC-type sugar transport system permease subunit